jgi:hypothetical protein
LLPQYFFSVKKVRELSGNFLPKIQALPAAAEVVISSHGYDKLAACNICAEDVFLSIGQATVVEDCLDFSKGPCILVQEGDRNKLPIRVVWGVSKGNIRASCSHNGIPA